MSDLAGMSDADLMAALGQANPANPANPPVSGLSAMSDADLMKALGKPPAPSVVVDVAKSAGTGLAKGAMGLAGLAGNMSDVAGNSAEWLIQRGLNAVGALPAGKQPQSYDEISTANRAVTKGTDILPRSADIEKGVEQISGPLHKPETTAGKYAETVGEFLPGAALMPGSIATKALRFGVAPGLASEAAGQATAGTPLEGAARMGAALLAPSAGRLITPNPVSAERQAMVKTLADEGVNLTAGQVTGSKPLRWAESATQDAPLAGGKAAAMDAAQRSQFTAATLKRMGIDADKATPDILAFGKGKIQNTYETIAARNTATFDQQFGHDLGKVLREYDAMKTPGSHVPLVENRIMGLSQMGGKLDGKPYQSIRSEIGKEAKRFEQTDPSTSNALQGIQKALDDVMSRSLTPEDAKLWKQTNREWANWKVIERAATSAGENAAQGNISPQALRAATVAQNRGAYAVGRGDFADLSRAGTALMSPLPNSGTAPRQNLQSLFAAIGAAGGYALGHGPGAAAGGLAGALAHAAGPAVAGRVVMSPLVQSYMKNQALAGPSNAPTGLLEKLLLANASAR